MKGRRLFKKFRKRKGKKELASASVARVCAAIQEMREQFGDHLPVFDEEDVLIKIHFANEKVPFHSHYFELKNLTALLYESFIFTHLAEKFSDTPRKGTALIKVMKDRLQALQESDNRSSVPQSVGMFLREHGERLFWLSSLLEELAARDDTPYKALCQMISDAAKEDLKVTEVKKWSPLFFLSWFRRSSEEEKTALLIEKIAKRLPALFDSSIYTKKQDPESEKPYQRKSSIKKCVNQYREMNRKPYIREKEDEADDYYGA